MSVFKRRKPDDPGEPAVGPGHDTPPHAGSAVPAPVDTGLGVPPFRPALAPALAPNLPPASARVPPPAIPPAAPTTREFFAMGRSPFAAATPPAPTLAGPQRLAPAAPGAMPAAGPMGAPPRPAREPAERRTLVVGRGISVQGVVQDAERLVVEGTVEATMIHAAELSISPGGVFKGEVEVEEAEVAGTIDGTLTARGNLVVRATGRVLGTARCRRLQVEDGGQITGRIEMLTEGAARPAAAPETREAAE